jgi:hypothetical protein
MRSRAIGIESIVVADEATDFSPEYYGKWNGNRIIKYKPESKQRKRYSCGHAIRWGFSKTRSYNPTVCAS